MRDSVHFRKQMIGVAGALAALVVVVAVAFDVPAHFERTVPRVDDASNRLAFVARWLLVPGLTLLAGVVVAARRGFLADAIDGTRTPSSHSLEINLRYNQNTLEQTVLAAIAWAGLALALPLDRLTIIPAMAIVFAVGRVTFWVGYLIHPMGRAFGMTLTAVPTLAAFGWLIAHALMPLLWASATS